MSRIAGLVALMFAALMLNASEARGAFGGAVTTKVKSPSLAASLVIDFTGDAGKGQSAIRAQKSTTNTAALFQSAKIRESVVSCANVLAERAAGFDRFKGFMNPWVDAGALAALLGPFGDPSKGVITDTDYASCTGADTNGDGTPDREFLSFTAVIQFAE